MTSEDWTDIEINDPNPEGGRARYWLFTSYKDVITQSQRPGASFFVCQRERCPSTNKEHWQGYIELDTAQRWSWVQNFISDRQARCFKVTEGTGERVAKYCSKDETCVSPSLRCQWGTLKNKKRVGGTKRSYHEVAGEALRMATREEAENHIRTFRPDVWTKSFCNISASLSHHFTDKSIEDYIFKPQFSWVLPPAITDWVTQEFPKKWPARKKFLIITGGTEMGKTSWARSLGKHMFWRGCVGFNEWVQSAKYIVIDDIPWKFIPMKKSLMTSMGQQTVTDKYMKKTRIFQDKPVIYLQNQPWDWDTAEIGDREEREPEYWKKRSTVCNLGDTLLYDPQQRTLQI